MLKTLFPFLIIIILFLNCGDDSSKESVSCETNCITRLTFPDVGSRGIFDPSLSQDPSTSRIWMSYSAVDPSTLWSTINYHTVSTRLAWSDNQGEDWTDSGSVVNPVIDVTLDDGSGGADDAGSWQNEVSKIIYDPSANIGEEWKLFWHHYLANNQLGDPSDYRKFNHGWIAYKAAASPNDLKDATEVKLFGAIAYDSVNDTLNNTTSRSPLGGSPSIMLNELHTDLNSCLAFSEPGVFADASGLYLSLFCYELAPDNNRLILLKCSQQSDVTLAGSWSYIGTIFTNSDALAMGYEKFSASDLFSSGGLDYLMVSPVSSNPFSGSYNGCIVFKFSDITNGTLEGSPTIFKSIHGSVGSFNGACGYHESATSSGFMYSEAFLGETDMFRIFLSGDSL